MRTTIDNLDGSGARDYSSCVTEDGPLKIERMLNRPSRFTCDLLASCSGLPLPSRLARVVVSADDGTVLFTGHLATEPVRVYAGEASEGHVYRAKLTAVSDDWVLDKLGPVAKPGGGLSVGLNGPALLERLAGRVPGGETALEFVAGGGPGPALGAVAVSATLPWSSNAGSAAGAAYAAYRAVNGQVQLQPAGTVTHELSDADGTLAIAEMQTSMVRELANDVTLSGEEEPAAYVSEVFAGDGTTAVFELSEAAFRGPDRTLVQDRFDEGSFDATQWSVRDPGSHLSLTSAGLTMSGGNGFDGQTTLTALDAVEMGGTIVVQMSGVVLAAASEGVLGGMYPGAVERPYCLAGFRVRQDGGATVLVPLVNGAEVGMTFTPVAGHRYTLRMRLHCVEMQRVMQRFYCMVDGVVQGFGPMGGVDAPLDVVFDVVDEGAASNTPATVLYDSVAVSGPGALTGTAATCVFAAVNAAQMYGSMQRVELTREGSVWVTSTLPSGVKQTRLTGTAGEGVDCVLAYGSENGARTKLTFMAGRVPEASERVTVTYRGQRRAVARLADAASIAAEAAGGMPGTGRWLGKVLQPPTRCSADCESAAQALLAFATSRPAAISGTYAMWNPVQDVWPGDVLRVTSAGITTSLLVRSVAVEDGHAVPEARLYKIRFANDWATELEDGLGLKLSEAIASDAVLPQKASDGPPAVLGNLQQMQVTALDGSAVQIDTGMDAPSGGGFEVRRRDWAFGPGNDADLVMRSPVRSFSVPRAAQVERFYVRTYDASTAPVYSRFSGAVLVNWPMG